MVLKLFALKSLTELLQLNEKTGQLHVSFLCSRVLKCPLIYFLFTVIPAKRGKGYGSLLLLTFSM